VGAGTEEGWGGGKVLQIRISGYTLGPREEKMKNSGMGTRGEPGATARRDQSRKNFKSPSLPKGGKGRMGKVGESSK